MSWPTLVLRRLRFTTHLSAITTMGRSQRGVPVDCSSARIPRSRKFLETKLWHSVYVFGSRESPGFAIHSLYSIAPSCTHEYHTTLREHLRGSTGNYIRIRTDNRSLARGGTRANKLSPATASDNWRRPGTTPTSTLHLLVTVAPKFAEHWNRWLEISNLRALFFIAETAEYTKFKFKYQTETTCSIKSIL